MTSTSASGESFSSRSTSQPRVIICIFIAMKEMNDPIHIQRKSRICSVSNIGDASMESVRRRLTATGTSAVVDEDCAVAGGALNAS